MINDRQDKIREILLMALWPEEFPDEMPQIEEYLRDFPDRKKEIEAMRLVDRVLKEHKQDVAAATLDCPSAGTIVDVAAGKIQDPVVEAHTKYCPDCAELVELVREISSEELSTPQEWPRPELESKLMEIVERHYGRPKGSEHSYLQSLVERVRSGLSFPSLAAGVALASLVFAVVSLQVGDDGAQYPVFSDVAWEVTPPSHKKNGRPPGGSLAPRKKVALILLASDNAPQTLTQVREIYKSLDIAERLAVSYDFLSPVALKNLLDPLDRRVDDPQKLASTVFARTDSTYVLTFESLAPQFGRSLKATLFRRDQDRPGAFLIQSGIKTERVVERIAEIGTELLLEVE